MRFAPYSFSRLGTHSQCGRRFKYQYIDKIPQGYVDRTALLKGGAVHSILEKYPEPSTHKLAPQYQHIADAFIRSRLGEKYLTAESTRELSFGLTQDFEPCGYSDPDAMFRGSIDFVAPIEQTLHLIDWKTGKYKDLKWQSFDQLMFYAIYFFQRYPNINKIKISYVYVEHEAENDIELFREYLDSYKAQLLNLINAAESDTAFRKCPSKLCEWCPYQEVCAADRD